MFMKLETCSSPQVLHIYLWVNILLEQICRHWALEFFNVNDLYVCEIAGRNAMCFTNCIITMQCYFRVQYKRVSPVGCWVCERAVERWGFGRRGRSVIGGSILARPGLVLTVGGHGSQTSQTNGEPVVTSWSSCVAVETTLSLEIRIHLDSCLCHSVIHTVTQENISVTSKYSLQSEIFYSVTKNICQNFALENYFVQCSPKLFHCKSCRTMWCGVLCLPASLGTHWILKHSTTTHSDDQFGWIENDTVGIESTHQSAARKLQSTNQRRGTGSVDQWEARILLHNTGLTLLRRVK